MEADDFELSKAVLKQEMSSSPQTPCAIQEMGDKPERPEKVTPIPEHEEFFLDGVNPVNDDQLPKGYYLRPAFLGTFFVSDSWWLHVSLEKIADRGEHRQLD